MKKDLEEILKENREWYWQKKREMIAKTKKEYRKEVILTSFIGLFIVVTTVILISKGL